MSRKVACDARKTYVIKEEIAAKDKENRTLTKSCPQLKKKRHQKIQEIITASKEWGTDTTAREGLNILLLLPTSLNNFWERVCVNMLAKQCRHTKWLGLKQKTKKPKIIPTLFNRCTSVQGWWHDAVLHTEQGLLEVDIYLKFYLTIFPIYSQTFHLNIKIGFLNRE